MEPEREPIIANPVMRRKLGWSDIHDYTADLIIKQYALQIPRDRELVRQLALLRVAQGKQPRREKALYLKSQDAPDIEELDE